MALYLIGEMLSIPITPWTSFFTKKRHEQYVCFCQIGSTGALPRTQLKNVCNETKRDLVGGDGRAGRALGGDLSVGQHSMSFMEGGALDRRRPIVTVIL
jgi:hypothetical protein